MKKLYSSDNPRILKDQQALVLLSSVQDLTTQRLMSIAYDEVRRRFAQEDRLPKCDFDMLFFMESIRGFAAKHDVLKRLLAGEDLSSELG